MSTYSCCDTMCSLWCTTTAMASKRSPDLSPIEHVWDMMKQELTLPPEPATTIAEMWQWVQDAWANLLLDDIWQLYDHLHGRILSALPSEEGTLCIDVPVWTPLTVTCVWIYYQYSYNDKLPVTSIFNAMNLSLKVLRRIIILNY